MQGIERVYIPNYLLDEDRYGIINISKQAFSGCSNLKQFIPLDEELAVRDEGLYLDIIDEEAFYNCSSLPSININTVQQIRQKAFAGCRDLYSFHIDRFEYIG
jgi:hypothetical protein